MRFIFERRASEAEREQNRREEIYSKLLDTWRTQPPFDLRGFFPTPSMMYCPDYTREWPQHETHGVMDTTKTFLIESEGWGDECQSIIHWREADGLVARAILEHLEIPFLDFKADVVVRGQWEKQMIVTIRVPHFLAHRLFAYGECAKAYLLD